MIVPENTGQHRTHCSPRSRDCVSDAERKPPGVVLAEGRADRREARELDDAAEIQAAAATHPDLKARAAALEVSPQALKRRMTALGLR